MNASDEIKEKHYRWETTFSLDKLYSTCDFVSLNIPATPFTKGKVNYGVISKMPHGGCLINTARKEVIDEAGLAEALETRPDICYVADVKPDNAEELITKYSDRVFFTPKKMGAQTAEANIKAGIAAAKQIVAYIQDGWNRFQVNK